MNNIFWDPTEKSIRGSFVNLLITVSILLLVIYGVLFDPNIVDRLKTLETLIVGFFATSMGIWTTKKILENKNGGNK